MNLWLALTTFGLVFVAELPDKTALASVLLGIRYRPALVFCGEAAAFTVHVVIAVTAGSLLRLLPHRVLEIVVSVVFLGGALWLLRGRHEEMLETRGEVDSPWRIVVMSFGVILVAEFGDLTQIVTANLAASHHDPIAVGVGALLALWSVAALAVFGGAALLRFVSMRLVSRIGAVAMVALAVVNLVQAAQ